MKAILEKRGSIADILGRHRIAGLEEGKPQLRYQQEELQRRLRLHKILLTN